MECPRSITFTIPGNPPVQVTIVENAGNLDFTVDVLDTPTRTADLRGLFFHFNESKLNDLTVVGGSIVTGWTKSRNAVLDLGYGNNMTGAALPFDMGIAFGTGGIGKGDDLSGPVTFTLDSTTDLTLDDIAHLEFGVRLTSIGIPGGKRHDSSKTTAIAPAAPDAVDDPNNSTHEDVGVLINVLANDSDGDGDALTIISIHDGPAHGTVAIAADGKSLTYTPSEDYSGPDKFSYCISDGNGGQDSAEVSVTVIPVADPPSITIEVLPPQANDDVHIVRLKITATQTDLDGSEFIDRITINGIPANVVLGTDGNLDPSGQPDQVVEYITLQLPQGVDSNFDLSITAYSQEEGNGDPDEASATVSKKIELDFTPNTGAKTFVADDQNIWQTGDSFSFHQSKFLGVDIPFNFDGPDVLPNPVPPYVPPVIPVDIGTSGHLKAGLQLTVNIDGGGIDAQMPYNLTVNTSFNKTSDVLLFESDAMLKGGGFTTTGPGGSFEIAPILDFLLNLKAVVSFLDVGIDETFTFNINDVGDIPEFSFGSDDLTISDIPTPIPGLTASIDWPDISVTGSKTGDNTLSGDAPSTPFFELDQDVETLAIALSSGLLSPLAALTDIHIKPGLNFIQTFVLTAQRLAGTITFTEDGTQKNFIFGQDLEITNASVHDVNKDGDIAYQLSFSPEATLRNLTEFGVSLGYSIDIFPGQPYSIDVPDGSVAIPAFKIYDDEFAFNFDDTGVLTFLA
jgi:hypothetical protein